MEVAKAVRSPDPTKYVCHFPVHQDGSCNGLQHYAALGRDQAGAESVNLFPFEKPSDVYSDVVELVSLTLILGFFQSLRMSTMIALYHTLMYTYYATT
jgi:DNA-directed RNA polymerase